MQKFKTSATEAVIGSHTYHTPVITLAVVKKLSKDSMQCTVPSYEKGMYLKSSTQNQAELETKIEKLLESLNSHRGRNQNVT